MSSDKMRASKRLRYGGGWMALVAAMGCGGSVATESGIPAAHTQEPMIAGVDVRSAALNAVGALVIVERYLPCDPSTGCAQNASSETAPSASYSRRFGNMDRRPVFVGDLAARLSNPGAEPAAPATQPPFSWIPSDRPARAASTFAVGRADSEDAGPDVETAYFPFCTGTLIGPSTVVTAKHCMADVDLISLFGLDVAFAVGPDATHPVATLPILDYDLEATVPLDPIALMGALGNDVAVLHLAEAARDVAPLAFAELQPSDVGQRFAAVGYGIQDNTEKAGTRKVGSLTLRGIGGNYADYAFGGREAFLKVAKTLPDLADLDEAVMPQIYDALRLLDVYQAFLGGRPGDAQPCSGDSGGPMIRLRDGVPTVFGLVTNGLASNRAVCDWGGVFAAFGPATISFLEQAPAWVDPCGGITLGGHCEGDTAVRCTGRGQGRRRLVRLDCSMLDAACRLDFNGHASCLGLDVTSVN